MVEIVKKVTQDFFEKILSGKKKFEVRIEDDCKFNEGDILILKEINENREFTGRDIKKIITCISRTKNMDYLSKEDIEKFGFTILGFD